jgi:ABC-type lipoprotein release transport system permease subunit
MITSISWKNVWRSRRRSFVIIIATTFGLWGGVYSNALFWGMSEAMVNTAIDSKLGHIQIHNDGYIDNAQIVNYIPEGGEVLHHLQAANSKLKAISGRTIAGGMASSPTSAFGVNIIGIDPSQEGQITDINASIVEGDYFGEGSRNAAIIGRKLAERLKLKLHNKIVVSFQGLDSNITYAACRIVGIYKTSSSQFDQSHVFMRHEDLWSLIGRDHIYHEIVMRTDKAEDLDSAYTVVAAAYPDLDVQTWKMLAPELALYTEMMGQYTIFFIAVILLALLFGITNTMFMAVLERIREIGVLLAIGMKRSRIFFMIVLETVFLTTIGGIIGSILAAVSISITEHTGIDLSIVGEGLNDAGMGTMLYPYLPSSSYIELFIMLVIAAVLAAIFPAWKAINTEPATAIRTY